MARIGNMLRQEIINDATISENLGNRLYPNVIPDDTEWPAAKWQRISGPRDTNLDGASGLAMARIQLDIYAPRHNDAQQVAEDIRKKFAKWKHKQMGHNPGIMVDRVQVEDIRDEQTDINTEEQRRRIDLMIHYQEEL